MSAITQQFTMYEWLPKILGPIAAEVMDHFDSYKPDVNAGIANEVATAALRFGHTMVGQFPN